MDEDTLRASYQALIPRYENLVTEIRFAMEAKLQLISPSINISGRVKDVNSLIGKIGRKSYSDPLKEITDLAGVRVICQFSPEVDEVEKLVRELFDTIEAVDKKLNSDRMGYQAKHFVVRLAAFSAGARYDEIKNLVCEIQVKTILQDAWAQIDHLLMYKSKDSIPERERRELNNVSSLLEIAQGIFDRSKETRGIYAQEVMNKSDRLVEFLLQPIDRETLATYTQIKYPKLPINRKIQEILIGDLDKTRYKTLGDIDRMVEASKDAVSSYSREAPELFQAGTDFLSKSLGFADKHFRGKHSFANKSRQAFAKFEVQVKGGAI